MADMKVDWWRGCYTRRSEHSMRKMGRGTNVFVECQQQDIFKTRDGIPGHGPQRVMIRWHSPDGECVILKCGCTLLIPWLLGSEREVVLRDVSPARHRKRGGGFF